MDFNEDVLEAGGKVITIITIISVIVLLFSLITSCGVHETCWK
jgi:hypothetical protein